MKVFDSERSEGRIGFTMMCCYVLSVNTLFVQHKCSNL